MARCGFQASSPRAPPASQGCVRPRKMSVPSINARNGDSWPANSAKADAGKSNATGASTRDAPGTYDAHYTPYAVDGDIVVARGTSVYQDHPDGPVTRTFDNCFLIRFDGDGRCAEFTELYMKRPR